MPELIPAEPGSPEWLAARHAGVTATDIVTILGLSAWDSVYSLFWRKLGQVPDAADNDRFRLGRELEPYVIDRWHENASLDTCIGVTRSPGLYRHSSRSWQMATLDAMACQVGGGQPLEIKTWADADRSSWQDGPPGKVRAQVLWQMDVMDVPVGHVGVVFLPSGEFRSYTIEHDHHHGIMKPIDPPIYEYPDCNVCTDQFLMRQAGEEFILRLHNELPPPDPDASLASLAAVRARFTRQPDKQAEVSGSAWRTFLFASRKITHWESVKRKAETLLREETGEASVLTVDGQPVARRVVQDQQVKAHTRHMDYLRRINNGSDDE
jgi:putative phage-type endonuclease